jgi:hypothetical protein
LRSASQCWYCWRIADSISGGRPDSAKQEVVEPRFSGPCLLCLFCGKCTSAVKLASFRWSAFSPADRGISLMMALPAGDPRCAWPHLASAFRRKSTRLC